VRHNFITNILSTTSSIGVTCYFWHSNQFKLHYCGNKSVRSRISGCLLLHPHYITVLFIAPHESSRSVCPSRTPNDSSSDNTFTSSPNVTQFDADVGSHIRLLPFRGNNQSKGVCVQKVRATHPTGLPRRARLPFSQPQRRTDSCHSRFAVKLCNGHLSTIILLLLGLTNTTSTQPIQKEEILLIKVCFPCACHEGIWITGNTAPAIPTFGVKYR
jgi:hypothetical protein